MDLFCEIKKYSASKGFRQSTPYVNAHRGKTMVIMLGGEAVADRNFGNIISDIALLHSLGVKIVLVHGARPRDQPTVSKARLSIRLITRILRSPLIILWVLRCEQQANYNSPSQLVFQ